MANQGQKDVFRRLLLLVAFRDSHINGTSIPSNKNAMCTRIEELLGGYSGNVKSWLIDNGKGTTSVPTGLRPVLDTISSKLPEIEGGIGSLDTELVKYALWTTHETAIERYLSGLSRSNLKIDNVLLAPDYDEIDPAAIDVQVQSAGEKTNNVLKAHLLYHSPVAASRWHQIKKAPSYKPLYELCEKGLEEILESEEWKTCQPKIRLVFNLGAGSPHKDNLILKSLRSDAKDDRAYVWIDASYPMLHQTIRDVDRCISNIGLYAIVADFEAPQKVEAIYRISFPYLPDFRNTPKAFFVLGYTLSNLDEEAFFSAYANVCRQGDLFIFPMHFIPPTCKTDSNEIKKFEDGLRTSYDFPEGRRFSEAGLSMLQLYKPKMNTHAEPNVNASFFNGHTRSRCIKFSVELENTSIRGVTKTVTTAQSMRHYKEDYLEFLNRSGFEKIAESTERFVDPKELSKGSVQTLLVKYMGKHRANPAGVGVD